IIVPVEPVSTIQCYHTFFFYNQPEHAEIYTLSLHDALPILRVNMLPDGTITAVTVSRSSGDAPFDNSAVAAVKNIGRLTEMQGRSEEHTSELQSRENLVCRLLLEKKKTRMRI